MDAPQQSRETQHNELEILSSDLLREIHKQVDPKISGEEIQTDLMRIVSREGDNLRIFLKYSIYGIGFKNGEYSCNVILEPISENNSQGYKVNEVTDARRVWD